VDYVAARDDWRCGSTVVFPAGTYGLRRFAGVPIVVSGTDGTDRAVANDVKVCTHECEHTAVDRHLDVAQRLAKLREARTLLRRGEPLVARLKRGGPLTVTLTRDDDDRLGSQPDRDLFQGGTAHIVIAWLS
jgi:hypothetical protein